MTALRKLINDAPRMLAYKLHRSKQPDGWISTLDENELEREVALCCHAVSGRRVNLDDPQTFTEKMQWLKVHDRDQRKTVYSDKIAVRDHIAQMVGPQVLPELYRVWDDVTDISFEGLPACFFLKCNNGSGMLTYVEDSQAADMDALRKKAAGWMAMDFASRYFEMQYADIAPKIYAEECLDDIEWEYQVWCFSGKIEFIAAIHDPHGVNEKQFFSPTWEKLPFVSSPPEYEGQIDRPNCLDDLLDYSQRLAEDYPFVRVDWYGTRHGLMFSELSFTPAGGMVRWVPEEMDSEVGKLLHLPIEG